MADADAVPRRFRESARAAEHQQLLDAARRWRPWRRLRCPSARGEPTLRKRRGPLHDRWAAGSPACSRVAKWRGSESRDRRGVESAWHMLHHRDLATDRPRASGHTTSDPCAPGTRQGLWARSTIRTRRESLRTEKSTELRLRARAAGLAPSTECARCRNENFACERAVNTVLGRLESESIGTGRVPSHSRVFPQEMTTSETQHRIHVNP